MTCLLDYVGMRGMKDEVSKLHIMYSENYGGHQKGNIECAVLSLCLRDA
jgi:hypothetical protein